MTPDEVLERNATRMTREAIANLPHEQLARRRDYVKRTGRARFYFIPDDDHGTVRCEWGGEVLWISTLASLYDADPVPGRVAVVATSPEPPAEWFDDPDE